jgi:hypothetical protein
MQTLNVAAGRTDEEYKAAEEQRRAELLSDSRTDATYFFVAAGLAALGTGLVPIQLFLPIRLNFAIGIGAFELLGFYGRPLLRQYPLLGLGAAAAWVLILAGLGLAARKGYRWAFLAGVVLYGADMVALAITFSWLSIGVHGFFVYKWFQGQAALRDLKQGAGGS